MKMIEYKTVEGRFYHATSCMKALLCQQPILFFMLMLFCWAIFLNFATINDDMDGDMQQREYVMLPHDWSATMANAYIMRTEGCHIPYMPVRDAFIEMFMVKPIIEKPRKQLLRVTDMQLICELSAIELRRLYNVGNLSEVSCNYTVLKRLNDSHNAEVQAVQFKLNEKKALKIETNVDLIRIDCFKEHLFYRDIRMIVRNRSDEKAQVKLEIPKFKIDISESETMAKQNISIEKKPSDRLSVLIFGIASLSHLNFVRQMPMSSTFIRDHLPHVEFWGYNIVEDKSHDLMLPHFSGHSNSKLHDYCPKADARKQTQFLWQRYKQEQYTTVYAEDNAKQRPITHVFQDTPTDFYMQPLNVQLEKECNGTAKCFAQTSFDRLYDLNMQLLPQMQQDNFFSIYWHAYGGNDSFNAPAAIDWKMLQLLQLWQTHGILNNSIVVLTSDEGIHHGSFRDSYQGMMEERQPLLLLIYPEWFKVTYAAAIHNMEQNVRQLVTPFDLHVTLLDLLHLETLTKLQLQMRNDRLLKSAVLPRAISLFLPIPKTRTCQQAGIENYLCSCHQQRHLSSHDLRAKYAAHLMVRHMNNLLKNQSECAYVELKTIKNAYITETDFTDPGQQQHDHRSDITLRINTKPLQGVFEATLRLHGHTLRLLNDINSLNEESVLVDETHACMANAKLKPFCHCIRKTKRQMN